MSIASSPGRIVSMDQFRGYTVAGMFVVNFLGHMTLIHPVMQHNDNYFSYADSIMPSFIFAAGFSYRLTILRRLPQFGHFKTYLTFFRRSVALILVSLMMYGFGGGFKTWNQFESPKPVSSATNAEASTTESDESESAGSEEPELVFDSDKFMEGWSAFGLKLLKSNLWEVLAIIGVAQIFIMPVIAGGFWVRFLAMIACGVGHAWLTHWFNWEFLYGYWDQAAGYQDNWMGALWGTEGNRGWDGGIIGIVSWSVSMLAGTLAYDLYVGSPTAGNAGRKLLVWGVIFMVLGYAMSCMTRLYDVEYGAAASTVKPQHAESPVLPPFDKAEGRPLSSLLAEPPFVGPPPTDVRLENYWLMGKRTVTLSFITFSTGFAFAAYALFVFLCDVGPLQIGVFRTFGTNPLAAYVIHYMWYTQLHELTPKDSPVWFCMVMMTIFMLLTYLFVRHLEKHKIFIRL